MSEHEKFLEFVYKHGRDNLTDIELENLLEDIYPDWYIQ